MGLFFQLRGKSTEILSITQKIYLFYMFMNLVCFVSLRFVLLFYNPDAYFIKEPDGERDDDEREGVGGGRDDGGDDEDGNNRVASVLRHPDGFHQVELGEQPGEDGNFEYDAKGKRHQEEGVDVGTDGQHVVYVGTDLVEPKEVDGEGEEEEVVEQDANEEREVGAEGDLTRVAPLIFVEGRGDEPEKDVQDVG